MKSLPLTIDELSPAWLGAALGGVEIDGFKVVDSSSGTTGRALLELQYAESADFPERLFIKLPPADPRQREFVCNTGMGRREALFYQQLSASVPLRVPRCYFADCSANGDRYLMVLEDLGSGACSFRNASQRYSMEYLREVLAAFASLHASFWNSPRFADELDWVPPPPRHELGLQLVQRGLDQYATKMPSQFAAMARLYIENSAGIHALWNAGVPTLVHGDCHDGNLFYDIETGRPGFLDWALVGRTSCMRDVAYFLAGTLRPEDRAGHLASLLDYYVEQLQRRGVVVPSAAELQQQYAWHVAYVWVAALTTLAMGSEWQPQSYVWRSMERLNGALLESDSIDQLQAALG